MERLVVNGLHNGKDESNRNGKNRRAKKQAI